MRTAPPFTSAPESLAPSEAAAWTERALANVRLWTTGLLAILLIPIVILRALRGPGLMTGDPLLLGEIILFTLSVREWWTGWQHRRRSRGAFLIPPLLMVILFGGVWYISADTAFYLLLDIVMMFIFLRVRPAAWWSLAGIVGVFAISDRRWALDGADLMRLVIASGGLLALGLMVRLAIDRVATRLGNTGGLLQASVDAMQQGLIVLGPTGEVQLFNERAASLLGLSATSATRRGAVQAGLTVADRDWPATDASRRLLRSPDGRWIERTRQTLPSGDIVHTLTDVTTYQEARAAAESDASARSTFLGSMSHELRTPLNAILGLSRLLSQREAAAPDRQRLDQITAAGQALLGLVEDAIDLSELESGRVQPRVEPVTLESLIREARTRLGAAWEARGILLDIAVDRDVPATVAGDPDRLVRVLTRLLSLAGEDDTSRRVTIRLSADREQDRLVLLLTDPGAATVMAGQVSPSALTILQRYVTHLGGVLTTTVSPEVGLVVTWSLPVTAPGRATIPGTDTIAIRSDALLPRPSASSASGGPPRLPLSATQRRVAALQAELARTSEQLDQAPRHSFFFGGMVFSGLLLLLGVTLAVQSVRGVAPRDLSVILIPVIGGLLGLALVIPIRRLHPIPRWRVMLLGVVTVGAFILGLKLNGMGPLILLPPGIMFVYLAFRRPFDRLLTVLCLVAMLIFAAWGSIGIALGGRFVIASLVTMLVMEWLTHLLARAHGAFRGASTLLRSLLEEVGSDNARLRESQARAERAGRLRSDLLVAVSHEIRTPMNAIIGVSHLLARTDLTRQQRTWLQRIRENGQHLLALINDALDLSRIEAGRLTLEVEPFVLSEILQLVTTMLADEAATKGLRTAVEVEPGIPEVLLGDRLRVTQVLINYVSNAVKYTAAGRIVVRVRRIPEPGERVALRFEVEDTGVGLTEAQQASVFLPYTRFGQPLSPFGGTGLGLSIVKWIVEQMDGQVGVTSAPGAGSIFWCVVRLLPADAREGRPSTQTLEPDDVLLADRQGARVLVVDDHPVNREIAAELVRQVGLEVTAVGDGPAALDALRSERFDAMLLDITMPGMDGFDVTRAVRAMPVGDTLPIVAVTANALAEDRDRCLAAGMNAHLGKPFDPARLWRILEQVIPPRGTLATPGVGLSEGEMTIAEPRSGPSVAHPLPPIRGLRYEAGVRLVAGNHAMYRRLLRDFAREHREDVSAIGTALALQDIERAERLAHTLKGVTGAIGAEAAYQAAADLDEALRQGLEPSDCRPLVEALRLAMEPLLADLHAVFPPR